MKDKNISETPSFHGHYRSISNFTHTSIGKPKFAELRPNYVLYSSDLQQNVCTCIYHENVILICQALHHIDSIYPPYSHDLPHKFVCFQPSDYC